MLVEGFERETLAGLVRAGLVMTESEAVRASDRTIEVERFRITDAGRQALLE